MVRRIKDLRFFAHHITELDFGRPLLGMHLAGERDLVTAFRKERDTLGIDFLQSIVIQVSNIGFPIEAIEQKLSGLERAREAQLAIGGFKAKLAHGAFALHSDTEGETAGARTVPLPLIMLEITEIPT